MSVRCWLTMAVLAVASCGACGDPTSPTPNTTPTPPVPIVGRPEATALENLALVRAMEKATGRDSILVWMRNAGAGEQGRAIVRAGLTDSWAYRFALANSTDPNLYTWYVRPDGRVEFQGRQSPLMDLDYTELEPSVALDSDRAAELALGYGGRQFTLKFPGSVLTMVCRWIGRRPTWEITFQNIPSAPFNCTETIVLDAKTGELLARTPAPCV